MLNAVVIWYCQKLDEKATASFRRASLGVIPASAGMTFWGY
jgi:hypothetical protein